MAAAQQLSATSIRSAAASPRPGTSSSAAATPSSWRASSARPPTSSSRTTSASARGPSSAPTRPARDDFEVHFASKAFPCTAVLRILREEGLACDVASGGELAHRAEGRLRPREDPPARQREVRGRAGRGGGRRRRPRRRRQPHRHRPARARSCPTARRQRVLLRVAPGVSPDTHPSISTGGPNTKFGFGLQSAPAAIERLDASDRLELEGLHLHIGSQIYDARAASAPRWRRWPARRAHGMVNLGGGLGVAYADAERPADDRGVRRGQGRRGARRHGPRRAHPRRARPRARGQLDRHALHGAVGQAQRRHLRRGRRRACPTTCARCSTARATRRRSRRASAAGRCCHLVGKHCESGDIIVRDAELADPRAGRRRRHARPPAPTATRWPTPTTASRAPPVVFVKDGDARLVVRRETYDGPGGAGRRACLSPSASACSATAPSARPSPSCSQARAGQIEAHHRPAARARAAC